MPRARPGCPPTRGALLVALAVLAALAFAYGGARAQVATTGGGGRTVASFAGDHRHVDVLVVPQQRVYRMSGALDAVRMTRVDALVTIEEQVATTRLQVQLENVGAFAAEAQVLIPVPDGAVVRAFDFEGVSEQTTVRLLERDDARRAYQSIVSRLRDPALLEFSGNGAIESSVFPVPAGGRQAVSITWEQVLEASGERMDYVLPRSEALGPAVVPWHVAVRIESRLPVSTVYSPSHRARVTRLDRCRVVVQLDGAEAREPGSFRMSVLRGAAGLAAGVMAYPDPDRPGGWFLLLSGAPELPADETVAREVLVVLDRSGSMRGRKFEQALEAARQVILGLREGEAFNILDYAEDVASFAPHPVPSDAASAKAAGTYLDGLSVGGGTDLHAALLQAVRQDSHSDMLPVVLFLTDGLPTVGVDDEARIGDEVAAANRHRRRLFTFGVGNDVNAPLLDRLADMSRATSAYVAPGEDVEQAVGEVYRRLYGPVLAEPELVVVDAEGERTTSALRELQPAVLHDLFADEQLTLLGRYTGTSPVTLVLSGRGASGPVSIATVLDPGRADPRHAFVPRLWASRRIATLVDEVRQSGAAPGLAPADARLGELVTEIVALSTQFGVLSEYTAFMATEGSTLWNPDVMRKRVRTVLASRALGARTGRGAVSQARNLRAMRQRGRVDRMNAFLDANMQTIQLGKVAYADDLAFFRLHDKWIDSRIIARVQARDPHAVTPTFEGVIETVDFGTPSYDALVAELEAEHRAGVLGLGAEILLLRGDRRVLIRPPRTSSAPGPPALDDGRP